MNIYKQRLLNVGRALRESPSPEEFDMGTEFHTCGTPGCAWGHYVLRADLQQAFTATLEDQQCGYARSLATGSGTLVYDCLEVREHFGIDKDEAQELFSSRGCSRAQSTIDAAKYVEAFAERKWPEPALRTDSELVADLMARIGKQTIPEGEIASPEYARA